MKNWREEVGGESLAELKPQKGIFQGDVLSSLIFVIAMRSLSHIFWKCIGGYKPPTSQEKIKHQLYMDEIKPFSKNEN